MSSAEETAAEFHSKGNAAFAAKDYDTAVACFTGAIAVAPSNHVFYSNRSAALASLHNYNDALSDAEKTVELKPDWAKGYSRLGAAKLGLNKVEEAIAAYKKGLAIEPENEALNSGLTDAESRARAQAWARTFARKATQGQEAPPGNTPVDVFSEPDWWSKSPGNGGGTHDYLKQSDFHAKIRKIQKETGNFDLNTQDDQVLNALKVLWNAKSGSADATDIPDDPEVDLRKKRESRAEPENEVEAMEVEPEHDPMEILDEEKTVRERKSRAAKEKELGNAAYKKKDFETAIRHYANAMELDDKDISYLTNRAAVYMEMGKFEECIQDCDKAVEKGRELRSDFKMIAKALTRKGTALVKMAKSSQDYGPAIETFQKALTEHRNPDTLKKLNDAEKAKKDFEQQEYFDPQMGVEEREKGNDCFKKQKYPDAVKHYTESLRRNPKDPKAFSNRAACYTKLGAMPEGLKDAEKCIELDPTFSKGYTRKGAIQFFMKEFDKALETYQEGLKHDPHNQELLDGIRRCVEQINKASRGDLSPEELKERQAKAMQDPEIQNILSDPVMRQVLADLQENPNSAQQHMKEPHVMSKIKKLISAGIVQMR